MRQIVSILVVDAAAISDGQEQLAAWHCTPQQTICQKSWQGLKQHDLLFGALQDCFTVPIVSPSDSTGVSAQLEARGSHVPANNTLTVVASYSTQTGEPRTAVLKASDAPALQYKL